ncbi:hypothetical protein [Sphaerotilus sp.]|uniref:hypothetical protein n=1 Tax=Sphaerotilus sp. TaxID=2093942 RepID=UPI002ACE0AE0|nr:hypothetical protein [Sphaerotilus sp.]MDZ7855950.1 hypothetical protein [Sphaerotilus sp.]
MRKLIFISFIVLGAAVGLFSALHDDWGVKAVMMTIGAVVGTVLGGALTGMGRRSRARRSVEPEDAFDGTPLEELDRNYWRDKGHPPFMKPSNAELDHHMFDPDRQD